MYDPVSILVIDGMPIQHLQGMYSDHLERLLEEKGPLYIESEPYRGECLQTPEEIAEWCDTHAGIYTDVCGLMDDEGNSVEWYVLTSTFYRFELDDEDRDAIEQYCIQGIELED